MNSLIELNKNLIAANEAILSIREKLKKLAKIKALAI